MATATAGEEQVAQLWLTDRATAYVRKVHCAVVSTASGTVQINARPKRHLPNAYQILVTRNDQFRTRVGPGFFWVNPP